MSDGGEGLLDALGGEPRVTSVTGPLGDRVEAEWRLFPSVPPAPSGGPVAVIEMARASGLALLPARNDEHQGVDAALRASTDGVGELILAARDAGVRRIIVGCGGSASTDGGWGAVRVVGSRSALEHIDLVVAADVRTTFVDAARVFGPQKGADPEQVRTLTERLERLVDQYRDSLGVDVQTLEGAGAAGGLAGGLAAVGGHIVGGFELVAGMVDLADALDRADVVMTGEGRLDATSLDGKVVGGVLEMPRPHHVLCVVGSVAADLPPIARRSLDLVVLEELVGANRARRDTIALVEEAVGSYLGRWSSSAEGDGSLAEAPGT